MRNTTINSTSLFELGQQVSEDTLTLLSDTNETIPPTGFNLELVEGPIPEHRTYQAESFHKLFRAHTNERREALETIYDDLGRPKNLLIMMFCRNFLPFFENWLFSCEKYGISFHKNLIVFCLDGDAARRAAELGVKYYFFDPEHYAPAGKSESFGDEWFRNTILYKNAVISEALTLGASVLFQDTDLIWFKDPFMYLEESQEHYDIQIMYDGPNPNGKPIYGNTGFIYLQSNDITKALFETALRNSAAILKAGQQQFIFLKILNFFLSHKLIRLHVLPEHMFLNGHLFSLRNGVLGAARNWKEEGIVMHYSWTENRNEKLLKLTKFGLNFSGIKEDTTQACSLEKQEPPMSRQSNSSHYMVTLHLIDNDSIEVSCIEDSPILTSILNSYFRCVKKSKKNELLHLQLDGDHEGRDIYLRTTQISHIEISPPLSEIALIKILYSEVSGFTKFFIRSGNFASRAKRKLSRVMRSTP